jgi:mannosyltransferase
MTSSGDGTVLTRPRHLAGRPATTGEPDSGAARGPMWMRVAPPLLTLAMALWGITGSSYWRDESATLVAVDRPFGGLVRLLGHVDAVHGAYYLIMWPLVRLAGTGELVTRLPSAAAMAVAAGLVVALGRRLVSPAAGLAAGLVFAAIPVVSVYAQNARSYAMVTALGTAASYLLLRLLGASGSRRGWLAGYAGCLAAMGVLNIFGLLLIPAHAVTVTVACLRSPDRRSRWSLALSWLAAAIGAVAVVSPVVMLAWAERSQLAWLVAPGLKAIESLRQLAGTGDMPLALGIILVCAVAASALAGRAVLRSGWPVLLLAVAVPWLIVPPGLLLAASQVTPLYTLRYVVFCGPAGALLAGAGLAVLGRAVGTGLGWTTGSGLGRQVAAAGRRVSNRLRHQAGASAGHRVTGQRGRRVVAGAGQRANGQRRGRAARVLLAGLGWATGTAALAVIAVFGLPAQARARSPAGHVDNIRRADRIIAANMRPGDAAIFNTPSNENLQAYPYGMIKLRDIARYRTPTQSDTLAGVGLPAAVVRQRIAGVSRLWIIEVHHNKRLPTLQGLGLRLVHRWHPRDIWLLLYAQGRN